MVSRVLIVKGMELHLHLSNNSQLGYCRDVNIFCIGSLANSMDHCTSSRIPFPLYKDFSDLRGWGVLVPAKNSWHLSSANWPELFPSIQFHFNKRINLNDFWMNLLWDKQIAEKIVVGRQWHIVVTCLSMDNFVTMIRFLHSP
jgi:hypothetical protein